MTPSSFTSLVCFSTRTISVPFLRHRPVLNMRAFSRCFTFSPCPIFAHTAWSQPWPSRLLVLFFRYTCRIAVRLFFYVRGCRPEQTTPGQSEHRKNRGCILWMSWNLHPRIVESPLAYQIQALIFQWKSRCCVHIVELTRTELSRKESSGLKTKIYITEPYAIGAPIAVDCIWLLLKFIRAANCNNKLDTPW